MKFKHSTKRHAKKGSLPWNQDPYKQAKKSGLNEQGRAK